MLPCMHERMVWLGAEHSFAKAQEGMAVHHGMSVGAEQIRQRTEQAGGVYAELQMAEHVEQMTGGVEEDSWDALADRKMVCVDAAKVRVIGQGWCDAKTLTIGQVRADGSVTDFSYFSRMMECHAFAQAAQGEAKRRRLAASMEVCAVMDGAEYNQDVVDALRPDATRILDFYHAVEHLAAAGRAVLGNDETGLAQWLSPLRHTLRHGAPDQVLASLSEWASAHPDQAISVNTELAYFTKRRDQITYALFEKQGWPLGSGAGESAHKTVLQRRMKGAGMGWAASNVNPMLALRNLICSRRWHTDWKHISARLCEQPSSRRALAPDAQPVAPAATTQPHAFRLRPAVPWRKQPVGRARYAPSA